MAMNSFPTWIPIPYLGNGILHRAVVALPPLMVRGDDAFEERIVFFESPDSMQSAKHLESLLSVAWCVNAENWCENGYIYNVRSIHELKVETFSSDSTTELYVLETGRGGNGITAIGPDRIHYARESQVDIFVTPRVAARLHELLEAVEILLVDEPRRRLKEH